MNVRTVLCGIGLALVPLALAACGQVNMPGSGRTTSPVLADPQRPVPPAPFEGGERERIAATQPYVDQAARAYEIDPNLIHAVIWVESRHVPYAKSSAGARGLMQLMPATAHAMAQRMGRRRARIDDPQFNVLAGTLYLSRMLERYEGDETLALAAYHAGPGNVDNWLHDGGLPPRSLEYVGLVDKARQRFEAMNGRWSLPLDDAPPAAAQTKVARTREPAPRPARVVPPVPEPAPEPVIDIPEPPPPAYEPRPAAVEPRPRRSTPRPSAPPTRPARDDDEPGSTLPSVLDL